MNPEEGTVWCDGCGVDMTWAPILAKGQRYCCDLCANGGSCQCGYILEEDEEEGPALIRQ